MPLPKQARFWSGVALLLAGLAVGTLRMPGSFAAAKGGAAHAGFPIPPKVVDAGNIALVSSPVGGDGIPQDTNSIAISPGNVNLLIGTYQDFNPAAPLATRQKIGVSLSGDNGLTWQKTVLPRDL